MLSEDVKQKANGRWDDILPSFGVSHTFLRNEHGPCPACGGSDRFRYDDKTGDGNFFCNGCGAGDGFHLVMRVNGWDFSRALKEVDSWLGTGPSSDIRFATKPPKKPDPKSFWEPVIPIPEDIVQEFLKDSGHRVTVWNPKREAEADYYGSKLRPDLVSVYRTNEGHAVGMVLRIVSGDGKKLTPQIIYATDTRTGEAKFIMRAFPSPKPLLGSENLSTAKSVFVVEGEKTHAAATRLLAKQGRAIITWPGGAANFKHCDWSVLNGKQVVIIPDADELGWSAAQGIADLVTPKSKVRICRPPEDCKKGWDLADAEEEGFTPYDADQHVKALLEVPGLPWKHLDEESNPVQQDIPLSDISGQGEEVARVDNQKSNQLARQREPQDPHYLSRANIFFGDWQDIDQKSSKPLATIENCEMMLDHYGISVRYNILKKSVEISIPGAEFSVDNANNVSLSHITSIAQRNKFPVLNLPEYVKVIADKNSYNPISDWILSSEWDGTNRLDDLLNTVKSPNEPLKNKLITRWLIMAVAAIFQRADTPFSGHGVLVFKSEQGLGKTTWVENLLPKLLSTQYIRTGVHLDPADKDQVIGSVTNWIVELGELNSTMRRDVDRLKAFITQRTDRVRRPYDRLESEYLRRTVFFASVNDSTFLKDDTGNRRWWVVDITGINFQHDIDMQQLWAQALYMYQSGASWWLTSEEQSELNESNSDFMEHDPVDELMESLFDWSAPDTSWRRISATEMLIDLGVKNPTRSQSTQAGKYLRRRGMIPHKSNGARFFVCPPLKRKAGAPDYTPDWLT